MSKIVLKHGNNMHTVTCRKCGCEFLYKNEDIETSYTRINAYESDIDYKYIVCPECGYQIKDVIYD